MQTKRTAACLHPGPESHYGGLVLVILLGLVLSVAAGLMSGRMMTTRGGLAAPTMAVVAGTRVIVQLSAVAGDVLEARRLTKQGDVYVAGSDMRIALTASTRFMMGGRADLRPGAVLQVEGVKLDAGGHTLQAQQAVILTGYVEVSP